ncbi:unnamed protein product [Chrysodeixis includens]|uniref:Uncharacterized protein n=1 Tax=Chrysodeixis includens TaxID=689277 RepID=A0A9N8KU93_CHRIL|nr:unnamed protein product [Chrysodeixis includens]
MQRHSDPPPFPPGGVAECNLLCRAAPLVLRANERGSAPPEHELHKLPPHCRSLIADSIESDNVYGSNNAAETFERGSRPARRGPARPGAARLGSFRSVTSLPPRRAARAPPARRSRSLPRPAAPAFALVTVALHVHSGGSASRHYYGMS